MRKLVLTAASAAIAAGIAAPAFAQERAPFTGARVGAIAGYDGLRPGSTADSDIKGDDQSASGLLYGVDAGYDVALGGLVVGIEGEAAGSTGSVDNDPVDPNTFGYGRVKPGRDLYVGGRVGVLATPTTLVYAKGGYTNARLDLTASDGTTETGQNFKLDGYRLGAGVEKAIGANTYAKIEYRYSNYGDARLAYGNGATSSNFDVDTDRHQVAVGVGVRF